MADTFTCHLEWSGAARGPTRDVNVSRDLDVTFGALPGIPMSAAPGYKGDPARLNPEQLLVASLSACQALTYLFLAARGASRSSPMLTCRRAPGAGRGEDPDVADRPAARHYPCRRNG